MAKRKPRLDASTIESLEQLLQQASPSNLQAAPSLSKGVTYLAELIAHYRDPDNAARRQDEVRRVQARRQEARHG
jgi:hypothetical protein